LHLLNLLSPFLEDLLHPFGLSPPMDLLHQLIQKSLKPLFVLLHPFGPSLPFGRLSRFCLSHPLSLLVPMDL
jgi:hypothetical protein